MVGKGWMCSDIEDDYMEGDEGPDAVVSDLAEAVRLAEAFNMDEAFDHEQGGYSDTETLRLATPPPRPAPSLPFLSIRKRNSSSSSSPAHSELVHSAPKQWRRFTSKQPAGDFVVKKLPDADELFPGDIDGVPIDNHPLFKAYFKM